MLQEVETQHTKIETFRHQKISMNYYNIPIEKEVIVSCISYRRKMYGLYEIRVYMSQAQMFFPSSVTSAISRSVKQGCQCSNSPAAIRDFVQCDQWYSQWLSRMIGIVERLLWICLTESMLNYWKEMHCDINQAVGFVHCRILLLSAPAMTQSVHLISRRVFP